MNTETNTEAKVDASNSSTTTTTTTMDAGKSTVISPREIEACIYYPELKSLLSGKLFQPMYVCCVLHICMYV